jgi:hypothetical protein
VPDDRLDLRHSAAALRKPPCRCLPETMKDAAAKGC